MQFSILELASLQDAVGQVCLATVPVQPKTPAVLPRSSLELREADASPIVQL